MTEINRNFYYWYTPQIYNPSTTASIGVGMISYRISKHNTFAFDISSKDLKTYHQIYDFCFDQATIRVNLMKANGTRIEYEL